VFVLNQSIAAGDIQAFPKTHKFYSMESASLEQQS
jgi:hypothetical protein